MDTDLGLRERKKQLTRRNLCEIALRLFDEQGYGDTTVSQIAAAAQVSRATFFNYFSGKEDVLFADAHPRESLLREAMGTPRPDESPEQALLRALDSLLDAPGWSINPEGELVPVRARLIATEPALRARALLRVADLHTEWTRALHDAFPHRLDQNSAAALIGALIGAVLGATSAHLRSPEGQDSLPKVVRHAAATILDR